ncbi:hypothetical protein FNX44_026180, partial [Streptomyces sp. OF1]|nr:hypothetical protein [Streptomyces alkaliterrae]
MHEGTGTRQLPGPVDEFKAELRALTAGLDAGQGWYAVFRRRDPRGVAACLDGVEVPPWDVVESLLQDVAAQRGQDVAARHRARLHRCYRPCVRLVDAEVHGPRGVWERLHEMRRVRESARLLVARLTEQQAQRGRSPGGADSLDVELAWARDDFARATARCRELQQRLAALSGDAGAQTGADAGAQTGAQAGAQTNAETGADATTPAGTVSAPARVPAPTPAHDTPAPRAESRRAPDVTRAPRRIGGSRNPLVYQDADPP